MLHMRNFHTLFYTANVKGSLSGWIHAFISFLSLSHTHSLSLWNKKYFSYSHFNFSPPPYIFPRPNTLAFRKRRQQISNNLHRSQRWNWLETLNIWLLNPVYSSSYFPILKWIIFKVPWGHFSLLHLLNRFIHFIPQPH